jgi:hypothetical protein
MLIPGRDRRCIRGLGSEGRPLLDEQHRQIGFLIRPQAARLPLANAPVAQPAEAGPLKGPQCGFESHRGHPSLPPASFPDLRERGQGTVGCCPAVPSYGRYSPAVCAEYVPKCAPATPHATWPRFASEPVPPAPRGTSRRSAARPRHCGLPTPRPAWQARLR